MEEKNYTGIIPDQHTGIPIDALHETVLDTEEQAKEFFEVVKTRLQNVNDWNKHTIGMSATFQLVDQNGVEVQRGAQKGDYFKINIPGPGTVSGEGYDWVQIEAFEETTAGDVESFGFRVRPAKDPQTRNDDVAHFYSPESTSTFTVTREGKKITAAIYDRNTKANMEAHNILDQIRDAVVGTAGVVAFSKIQWSGLTEGLLKR